MRSRWFLAVTALGLVGCSENPATTPSPPDVDLEQLIAARESKAIDGKTYALDAYLWRDFQPIAPPDGKPLIAVIRVIEQDSDQFSPEVDAVHLWVVNNTEVWSTPFTDEDHPPRAPNELEKVARDGPKWGPGIDVDIVVGLRGPGDEFHLLAKRDQRILRTD
jgi:hypothetical protein